MKKVLSLVLVLVMVFSLAACGKTEGNSQGSGKPQSYSLGTASSGGMMYAIGSGWASLMNNVAGDRYSFTAEETAGNSANIAMIESGEIEFCCNGTMSLYEGYQGKANWTSGNTYNKIRVMFPLNQMVLTAYTLEENNIHSLSDLEGKVVGLGSKGGAVDSLFRSLFDELGIKVKDYYNDGWSATVSALSDGNIDAGITFQLSPAAALVELDSTKNVAFLNFTDKEISALKTLNPALADAKIAAGSYKSVTEDIKTVGDIALMCCSVDVPDDVVYDLVKTTYENASDMQATHNAMSKWSIDDVSKCIAQFHPGAIKYFEEKGIKMPDPTVVPSK